MTHLPHPVLPDEHIRRGQQVAIDQFATDDDGNLAHPAYEMRPGEKTGLGRVCQDSTPAFDDRCSPNNRSRSGMYTEGHGFFRPERFHGIHVAFVEGGIKGLVCRKHVVVHEGIIPM